MTKKMLINANHPEENRVAIVEDGILTELDIEIEGKEQTKGNIYKAAVIRVEPGLQAAFVDYGAEKLGFLQMGELHPSFFRAWESRSEGKRARINDILHKGQEFLVQVTKEERGTKGAALTTYLSLAGRYMVLMPDSDTKGVSRKIEEDAQRKKIKEAMASLDLPQQMGYIVRTAGIGQTKEELKRDFDYLVKVYENIQALGAQVKAPALIYKESNLMIRSIRDYFSADMDEVLVDDSRVFQEATDFFKQVMPDYVRLVKLHQERRPIFSRYQIEEQIETIYQNKVPLPSGGSIVIDSTEALVAIDVNSGKMAGEQGVEATAYKTNLEAATEAGRQLRLRDLGGLVVIDFIDMRDRKHIRAVEKALRDALKSDKARVTLGRISQFGLLEMSRQRIKATLAEGAYLTCPHCNGSGRIKSAEAQSIAFLRRIHAGVAKGQIGRVEGEVPLEVATYLLNAKREELLELERRHNVSIVIKGRPDFTSGQTEVTFLKREKEESAAEEVEAVTALSVASSPVAETEKAANAQTKEEGGTEEGAKKKRKRHRRKKKPAAQEPLPAAQGATGEQAAEAPAEAAPVSEPSAPASAAEAAPEAPAEEEGQKRRRRRRRKKPAEMTPGEEPATAAAAPEAASPPTAPLPVAETEAPRPAAEQGAAAPPEEKAAPVSAGAPPLAPAEATPEAPPTEEAAPETPPPAKAPRRRRRKKAEEAPPVTAAENPGGTSAPLPAEPPRESPEAKAEAPAAPAPAREENSAGKETAKPAAAPTAAPEAAAETAPKAEEPAAQEEKPKPARKRAPRKKAAPAKKTAAAPDAEAPGKEPSPAESPAAPAPVAGTEEKTEAAPAAPKKPARRRTTRTSAKKPAEPKAASAEDEGGTKKEEGTAEAEKSAPKRTRRTTRKTPAATKAKEGDEEPKKRPVRRRTATPKKAEKEAEKPPAEEKAAASSKEEPATE